MFYQRGTEDHRQRTNKPSNGFLSLRKYETRGIFLAAQCCEHLNRALVIELLLQEIWLSGLMLFHTCMQAAVSL